MGRPGVARVAGQRLTGRVFGAAELVRLLEPEGVGAEEEARQRIVAIPGWQDARDRIAHGERLAEEEIGVLPEAQRQRVGRPVGQNGLPDETSPPTTGPPPWP